MTNKIVWLSDEVFTLTYNNINGGLSSEREFFRVQRENLRESEKTNKFPQIKCLIADFSCCKNYFAITVSVKGSLIESYAQTLCSYKAYVCASTH